MASATSPHDDLIQQTIGAMRRHGMTNILASHLPNLPQPQPIGSFIPDVTAFHGTTFYVAECESQDGLSQQHTLDQWRTFYNYAVRVSGCFVAVVAVADKAAALALMRSVAGTAQNALVWTF
jgi:hypothetical protein